MPPASERTAGMRLHQRQSLFASGGLTLAAAIWTTLLSLVVVPVMIEGLGVATYGIYSVAFSVAALGSYLDFGLGWTTTRFVADADVTARSRLGTIVTASALYHLVLGLLFAAIVLATASVIASSLLELPAAQVASARTVLRITAVSFVASSVMGVFVSALRGLRRFAAATIITTLATTASVGGAALAAAAGQGIIVAALAQLAGAVGGMAAAAAACAGLIRLSAPADLWRELRGMLGFSIWNYATRLVQLLTMQADKILVARWLGPAALAVYAVTFNFAQRVNILGGPAVTAIYPVAAATRHDRAEFIGQYLRAARLLHVMTAALALTLIVWGDHFLAAWVGSEMALRGGFALRALTVGFWLLSVGSFDGGCIEGWSTPRLTFAISATGVLTGLTVAAVTQQMYADATVSVPLGVSTCFVVTGAGQMIVWQRLSRYPAASLLPRVLLTVVEMAIIAAAAAAALDQIIEGRVATIAALFALVAGLGGYGIWRAHSGEELRFLRGRLLSPFVRAA